MVKLTHFAIENIVVNCKIVELLQWMKTMNGADEIQKRLEWWRQSIDLIDFNFNLLMMTFRDFKCQLIPT